MEYTNSQISRLIAEHIHSQRDREIMSLRLIDGLTFERLSERMAMSTVQVKRIVYREKKKLFSLMSQN